MHYEASGEAMLWIYSLPDADENTSLLEIGRATTTILKEFFQAESLTAIGSWSQKEHEDTLERLKECESGKGERHECKDYERRLNERAYLNGSGEISHFSCQHPKAFQNDEIYGFWFQRCIGALSNKECDERRLPHF